MNEYIVGIDLGGMSAKGALFSFDGAIICEDKVETNAENGFEKTVESLARLTKRLSKKANIGFDEIKAIGVGSPGVVDSANGIVLRWTNFGWNNVSLAGYLGELTGKKVAVANDANVAALGEAYFGATAQYQSSILLTIGTGIGGGMVFDGKLIEGYKSAGAELGHITIREVEFRVPVEERDAMKNTHLQVL